MKRGDRSQSTSRSGCDNEQMRLRDLIPALRAQSGSAHALLQRIDPAVADELYAYAAHRHIDPLDLAADCLEQLAADAADTVWRVGIERHREIDADPEAGLLGSVLLTTIRSRQRNERLVGSEPLVQIVHFVFRRIGHPYTSS